MNTEFLKWLSTSLVLSGVLLTNLNIYPLNIFIHSAGVASWTVAGILMQDKAIATNFGHENDFCKFDNVCFDTEIIGY